MSKKLNKHTEIKGYEKHSVEAKLWGWQFRILANGVTYVIDCKWKDRMRLPDGRIISNTLAENIKNG